MASPGLFGMSGSVELRVDRFFSLGPMLQLGVDSTEQIFVPTLNARFILPTSVMRENVSGWPPLELSLHTGFGVISHNDDGFRRTAVAYQAGLNADYYLMDELTVGLGASVVVTGDSTEKSVALMDASAAYHF
jgi:hypothetical protein